MFFMLFARSTPASSLASACDYGDDGFVDFEADNDKSEDGDDDGVWCEQQYTPRPVGHEGLPLLRDSSLPLLLIIIFVIPFSIITIIIAVITSISVSIIKRVTIQIRKVSPTAACWAQHDIAFNLHRI